MKNVLVTCTLLAAAAAGAAETNEVAMEASAGPAGLFASGRYELGLNSGVIFSPFIARGGNRPRINYTLSEVQFGYMLSNPSEAGLFSGNLELLGEGFGGELFEGKGNYVAGGTAWLRYNFVRPQRRLVPFAQAGLGIAFTDLDRRITGENFNFNLDLGVGLRYMMNPHWALSAEYRYQHISNANLSAHNLGVNADGPMLGLSYLF